MKELKKTGKNSFLVNRRKEEEKEEKERLKRLNTVEKKGKKKERKELEMFDGRGKIQGFFENTGRRGSAGRGEERYKKLGYGKKDNGRVEGKNRYGLKEI